MQLSHLGVVSHDDISKQKGVCKKCSSVCDCHHRGDYLFAALWNVHSLVECVSDARIFSS